jgi:cyanide hydratase
MCINIIKEIERTDNITVKTFIGPDGNILLHRRKFKPTSLERVVFGDAVSIHSTSCYKLFF